jgi:membrane-bound lytic murein transglycosylase B
MKMTRSATLVLLASLVLSAGRLSAQDYTYDPADVDSRRAAFVDRLVREHGLERETVVRILDDATIQQSALNAISRPAERVVPWFEYREIFLNDARIEAGAAFWAEHEDLVAETSARFGVDAKMLLAILGIESLFGERMGNYRVVDSLSTLAFAYPPRADFFASELESFFLIWSEEGAGVLNAMGSYAGAMGAGQFIPSSYRAYAVDADSDGQRDLWGNWPDILASIANYLSEHGWQEGGIVAVPASLGTAAGRSPGNRLGLDTTVAALRAEGYEFSPSLDDDLAAMLVAVEAGESETGYFVGLQNFHVITRYNRSVKYALAAFELAEAIEQRYRDIGGGSAL